MSETNEEKRERCFVIMPISDQGDYPAGHFTKVYEQIIKPSVEDAGYEAYRIDENNICDPIINKIFEAIQECPMAICDLSNRNPNVLYELGLRQAYDKPVVLIQDDKTKKIFDVSGISTVFYKSARQYEDVLEARENIKKAILETKKGKFRTLAKIVKVTAANFSQVEVSQNDKINVILEEIYSEIRELRNRGQLVDPRNNDIAKKLIHMSMYCTCDNSNTIDEYKRYLNDENKLAFYQCNKCGENKWNFDFYITKLNSFNELIYSTLDKAFTLNIKFDRSYELDLL